MLDTPETEHKKYHYKATEFGDGTPYISTEPVNGKLEALKHRSLYFTLPEDTTLEEAEEIAEYLNKRLITIATTTFGVDIEIPREGE